MREFVKGVVMLVSISFLLALIQACSLDNGILKPLCPVLEMDLDERWWYPQNIPAEPALYFQANGLIKVEGQTDSLSFVLENCNKLNVTNLTAGTEAQWVIKSIIDDVLSIQFPARGTVIYSRKR